MGHYASITDAEYELVRLFARARLDDHHIDALEAGLENVDWKGVIGLAAYHRVLPMMWVHLKEHEPEGVPPEVVDYLRRRAVEGGVQVLFLSAEMAKIARALKEVEIPFLVLKGPSLAEAYGGMAYRPFVDNDLLVRAGDFSRLERVLLDIGFDRLKKSERQLKGYLFVHGEYTFGRRVGTQVSTVDAHTSVVPRGYSYAGDYDVLIQRSREITVGGEAVRALGWHDLFLTLCVNALKDQWNRLRLASDLAQLGPFVDDWNELETLAEQTKSLRAFRVGVLVAADEIGAPFPKEVVDRARSDPKAASLSVHVQSHLRTFHEEWVMSGGDRARLVLQAQDDVRGQIRYLSYVALRRLIERMVSPHEEAPLPARPDQLRS